MNPKVEFIEFRNYRYIYLIDDVEVDLKENLSEYEILQRLFFVNNSLKSKVDFREGNIDIPLRDFMLFGYLFFRKQISEYFQYYIEKLILDYGKKRITEVLVQKYIFNSSITEVQYTLHITTDKSNQKYNDMIRGFVSEQIIEGKKYLVKKMLVNKDIVAISKVIKLITLDSFLQICGSYCLGEALKYFDFVINKILIPSNIQLSLNIIIAWATGLSCKSTKDSKNLCKSVEKERLYNEIETLINKYKSNFYLFKEEFKYLKNLEKALDKYKKLNENELVGLKPSRALKICMELYKEKFALYLAEISNKLDEENIIINRTNVTMEIFSNINEIKANHIYTYYKMNDKNTMLEDFITTKFKNQVKIQDKPIVNIIDDTWIFYWRIKESLKRITINFTELKSSLLKNEIKQYFKFIITKEYQYKAEGDGISKILSSTNLVFKSLKFLQKNYTINSAKDIRLIHVYKLVKYLQNEYKTKNDKKIKVSTIVSCVCNLKGFIDWLIETDKKGLSKPTYNPFQYVVFKGVYNKNTDIIPECVIDKILLNLNELREDIQRMVLIMLNCGLRYKEVAYLEEDCILESNSEYKILKYIPYKVLEARRRNGLDDYHRIVIDDEIYKEIEEQKEYTRDIREKYSTSEIFLTIGINDNLCMIDNVFFCRAVQRLIDKYNITDEQGKLWHITSKQYRKTLAVEMITKGEANEHEVGNFLGHLNPSTTKEYYAEVRKKKLADLNSDFFKKKFQLLVEEKHLERFSEEERKSLYVDFCLNIRDVEYGVCTRVFTVEKCNRRGDIFGCATCSKICTGKRYYKRWAGLYENQRQRVELLVNKYKDNGINCEEYMRFREYEREKYLLDSFEIVVNKLKGEYGDGN